MNIHPVLVHQIFGTLIAALALIIQLFETGVLQVRFGAYLPGWSLLGIGALLFLDPWLFHAGGFGAEGHQHTAQGLLAIAVGTMETWSVHRRSRHVFFRSLIPAVLAVLGLSFLWHEQHQTTDILLQTVQHRVMGATLLLAAGVKLVSNLSRDETFLKGDWALVMLAFALQLLLYTEPVSTHLGH